MKWFRFCTFLCHFNKSKQRQWPHCPPSAPSPLVAAEVLYSDGSHSHLFQWVEARGKWWKNKPRRGQLVLYALCRTPNDKLRNLSSCERPLAPVGNGGALQRQSLLLFVKKWNNATINPWTRGKQTMYSLGWRLRKEEDKKEKSSFSYLSFGSSFDNLTMETGREVETAAVAWNMHQYNNQTVRARRKNNLHTCLVKRLKMRRRRSKLTFFSSSTETENDATARLRRWQMWGWTAKMRRWQRTMPSWR